MAKRKKSYEYSDFDEPSGGNIYFKGEYAKKAGPAVRDYQRSVDFLNSVLSAYQADEEAAQKKQGEEEKFGLELYKQERQQEGQRLLSSQREASVAEREAARRKAALRQENLRGFQQRKTKALTDQMRQRELEKRFAQQEKIANLRGSIQERIAKMRGSSDYDYTGLVAGPQSPMPGMMAAPPGTLPPPPGQALQNARDPYEQMTEDELFQLAQQGDTKAQEVGARRFGGR